MGGPERPPKPPGCSERPGEAVALLCFTRRTGGVSSVYRLLQRLLRSPHEARDFDDAFQLAPLFVDREGVAVVGAGEAALR
jgi:hypothetical protein